MRIFVTGGTGFVGPAIVRALVARGHAVTALVHRDAGTLAEGPRLALARGDATDPASLARSIAGHDAVVHLVAIRRGSERDFERLHVEATRNVLDAARRAGATRFLHMSAHGVRHDGTPYQRTKWQAEGLVRASGLAWTIFRPTFVTGPAEGAAGSADHEFAALLKRTHALPNFRGGQLRLQPIAKRDVADAFAAALERPAAVGQAYELAGPDVLSWEEYARALGREVGVAPHLAPAPEGLLLAAAGVLGGFSWFPASKDELRMLLEDHVADPAPAQRDLGLQLTPFAQALHEALQTSPSGPVRRA